MASTRATVTWKPALAAAILMAFCGCAARLPGGADIQPTVQAEPTAAPTVGAGDHATVYQDIEQRLEQIQTTLTTVTTNYALDGVRRLSSTRRPFTMWCSLMAAPRRWCRRRT